MPNLIKFKRRINGGSGSPLPNQGVEGEVAFNAPNAAGSVDTPEMYFHDGSNWRRVNPAAVVGMQTIQLGASGADIGAAYAAWAAQAGNVLSGQVTMASFGSPVQTYMLINRAAPTVAGSWYAVGGAIPFATANEVHAGTNAVHALSPKLLRDETLDKPSGPNNTATMQDADKLIRLDQTGHIDSRFLGFSALTYRSTVDVTAAYTPPNPVWNVGDFGIAAAAGTAHASWPGLVAGEAVATGDLVLFDGTNYHLITNNVNLANFLALAGGTMEDGAGIVFDTTAAANAGDAATQVVIDGQGGTIDNVVIDGGTY